MTYKNPNYHKEYYIKNKERISKVHKEYRKSNKEKISKRNKIYNEVNKEKIIKHKKLYYRANKEKISKWCKLYRITNKEKIAKQDKEYKETNREKKNIYNKKRKSIDVGYRLKLSLRQRLFDALNNYKKSKHTMELVGCSLEYLKNYIECQFDDEMCWSNWGRNGWHIDHIKPCATFDLSKEEEQKKCFHYSNLQPLWAKANLSKGCKV